LRVEGLRVEELLQTRYQQQGHDLSHFD